MKVSIIIPTYNCKRYISEALESILNQTYRNIEIIVIDDGSTDGTENEICKYLPYIKYLYKPNGGEASARNTGLELSSGDLITFLDADDTYKSNKIEMQINEFANSKIDVVYNAAEVVDEQGNYIYSLFGEEEYANKEDFFAVMLWRQIIPVTASIMFKRECIDGGFRYPTIWSNSVDYAFTLQLASKYNFKYIPEALYRYRRHNKNLTNNHLKQLECEKQIVKTYKSNEIESIIENTTFSQNKKFELLSKIFYKIDDVGKSIAHALNIDEDNFSKLFQLGVCYYKLGNYEIAQNYFMNILSIDNNRAEALNNLGCCICKTGKGNPLDLFKQALTLRSNYQDAIDNISFCKTNIQNIKLTERELRKTLTLYK